MLATQFFEYLFENILGGLVLFDEFEFQKSKASNWFLTLRTKIIDSFQCIEETYPSDHSPGCFVVNKTKRHQPSELDGGGGIMSVMRNGRVFEKVGVNVSTVYGPLDKRLTKVMKAKKHIKEVNDLTKFWASGISVVAHMQNPNCPAIHMNTRMFWTPDTWWFGGGADLNPSIKKIEDTNFFRSSMKACCDRHDKRYYRKFKKWADDYFYIPHRKTARGVGGIFFDDLNTDWHRNFSFVQDVGTTFLSTFKEILNRRINEKWSDVDKDEQLRYRGLYAEYNLIYDRGTKFGLESGHDPDAVLMSLPPAVKWY